jgi:hypothetical protein
MQLVADAKEREALKEAKRRRVQAQVGAVER